MIRPAVALVLVVALAGCTPSPSDPLEVPAPASDAEVNASGTVIDDGKGVNLCFVVMESYPPQCGSPLPLEGWSWDDVEQLQEASRVRWGEFTVTGEYDDGVLTLTRAPEAGFESEPWPSHTGPLDSDELATVQAEIERDLPSFLDLGAGDGFVHVSVTYDDGSLQAQFDERYGDGAVIVSSLLKPA